MKLFHGSEKIVAEPQPLWGNPSNDYGQGFYCTEDAEAAKLWACKKGGLGYVNSYDFNPASLRKLDLTIGDEKAVLGWLTLLLAHRFAYEDRARYRPTIELLEKLFPIALGDYDYVVGYRADDNYFAYSRDFLANTLPYELLIEAMRLGKLGLQCVLLTEKSFSHLHYLGAEPVQDPALYSHFKQTTNLEYALLKSRSDPSMHYLNEILKRYRHD